MTRYLMALLGRAPYLIGLAFGVSACRRDFCCEAIRPLAVVYGTVRDTAGRSVGGVQITADALQDSCSSNKQIGWTQGTMFTDAFGNYRTILWSSVLPGPACPRITAHPSPGSPWRDTTVNGALVNFRSGYSSDSVRVDVVLPP